MSRPLSYDWLGKITTKNLTIKKGGLLKEVVGTNVVVVVGATLSLCQK